jgi:crotonobetainyl-CoA:carnitine CoA-transferase CaiB-like acyl-CoA transferase
LGPLYRLYQAAEGWVFVAAPRSRDFERLCDALEIGSVAVDERFATAEARALHADALAEALGAAIAKRDAEDLEADLTARGIACMRADQGPYRSWLFDQEWAREQGVVVDIADSVEGPYTRYGAPVTNDRPVPLQGAFASGANTRDLLLEIGFSEAEVATFLSEGIVAESASD